MTRWLLPLEGELKLNQKLPFPHVYQDCHVLLVKVSYQREVDKDKLTAVASFEKLNFRA